MNNKKASVHTSTCSSPFGNSVSNSLSFGGGIIEIFKQYLAIRWMKNTKSMNILNLLVNKLWFRAQKEGEKYGARNSNL